MAELTSEQKRKRLALWQAQNASPEKEMGALEYADNIVRNIAEGLTFGWAGEIAAKADELTGRGGSYDENLQREIAKDKAFQSEYPVASTTAQIGGALATGGTGFSRILGTKAVQQAPRALQYLTAAGVGATEGAIAGAGSADPGKRDEGAAIGATGGAILGATIPMATDVVKRRIWEPIATRISKNARATTAGDYLERMAQLDRNSLDDVAATMRQKGPAAAAVDTGRNMEALGMNSAQNLGDRLTTATDFVLDRRANQFSRLMDGVENAIGPAGKEVMDRVEGSAPFVASIQKDISIPRNLLKIMQRPSMQKAWEKARKLAAEQDISLDVFDDFERRVKSGEIVGVRTELMHYLKKGLDDVIEPKRDVFGNVVVDVGKNEMAALQQTRAAFRNAVRALNPDYGKQLDRLSAEFRVDDAFTKGQDFFKWRDQGAIAKVMKGMNEREQRAFRMGIGDAIEQRIMRNSEAGNDASSVLAREIPKLRIAFGEKGGKLADQIKNELNFMRTENRIAQGSQTAFRRNVDEVINQGAEGLDSLVDVGGNSTANIVSRAVSNLLGPTKPSAPVLDELADVLFSNDPRVIEAIAAQRRAPGLLGTVRNALPHTASGAASLPGLLHN